MPEVNLINLLENDDITTFSIPEGTTKIGEYAFYYKQNLESIEIPNSVESIGSRAFYNCSALTSVSIPDSVTYIGERVHSKIVLS